MGPDLGASYCRSAVISTAECLCFHGVHMYIYTCRVCSRDNRHCFVERSLFWWYLNSALQQLWLQIQVNCSLMATQRQHCSCFLFPSPFSPFVRAGRRCNDNGVWGEVDFLTCTLQSLDQDPFILLWLYLSSRPTQAALPGIANAVCLNDYILYRSIGPI